MGKSQWCVSFFVGYILFDTYRINECCVSHGCCKVYK